MTPEVAAAIEEIRKQFDGHAVLVGNDQHGGACVIVEGLPLGTPYAQFESWVGFHITHACPYADVYPHFVRADLSRLDKKELGEATSPGHTFPQPGVVVDKSIAPRPALQLSRRSNRRDLTTGLETPLIKLLKVLQWLKSR
jgi:hypothetical protein